MSATGTDRALAAVDRVRRARERDEEQNVYSARQRRSDIDRQQDLTVQALAAIPVAEAAQLVRGADLRLRGALVKTASDDLAELGRQAEMADLDVASAIDHWQAARTRRRAVELLIERRGEEAAVERGRREQRDNDEFAASRFGSAAGA